MPTDKEKADAASKAATDKDKAHPHDKVKTPAEQQATPNPAPPVTQPATPGAPTSQATAQSTDPTLASLQKPAEALTTDHTKSVGGESPGPAVNKAQNTGPASPVAPLSALGKDGRRKHTQESKDELMQHFLADADGAQLINNASGRLAVISQNMGYEMTPAEALAAVAHLIMEKAREMQPDAGDEED